MNKKYEYKCTDLSILTPAFRDHITAPILKYIPIGIHPNLITVVSFLFSLTGLSISYFYEPGALVNLMVAICLFLYLLFDHLDGMQAKRRGGGSPLGEWMDHFLDVLVNGIVMLTLVFLFEIHNPFLQIILFSCSYIAQAVVFLEQRQSDELHFGRIESLEAVVILCVLIFLSGFEAIRGFLAEDAFFELRYIDWLLILSSISGMKVILEAYSRIGSKLWPISTLIVSVAIMAYLSYYQVVLGNAALLIAVSAILINQEYLIGHLTGNQNLIVDFWPILGFSVVALLGVDSMIIVQIIAVIVLIRFIITVNILRKYNPSDFE